MPITLTADFDGGNIEVLENNGGHFDLAIRPDTGSHYYQWFFFQVDGARDTDLTLRITNAGGSAYPGGWQNYRARVSDSGNWVQTDTDYADGVLTIRHRPHSDSTRFAYFAPYPSERHTALVAQYAAVDGVDHRVLGQSLDGRPLDLLTLGEGPLKVWFYARQHPGETMAEWWMEGALELLTGDDAAAVALRKAATIHVVPNMNPDGSARGHLRTNAAGTDLNREWAAPTLERSPEIVHVLGAMVETGVDFAIDVHGDEAIPHVFMAGFDGIPSLTDRQAGLYTTYLAGLKARTPDFQTTHGYPVAAPGRANLAMSTAQLAERFGAVSMTLEMPFKDHDDAPDAVHGWSPERSAALGKACVLALVDMLDALKA